MRVVTSDGGDASMLRSFGPGDHIGELAVLREAPRAATVCRAPGVRRLVIGGEAVGDPARATRRGHGHARDARRAHQPAVT